jgi:colanic acid/amylovoran biosynthesis protein
MKNIKLFAYFADNLGDDLMIHTLLTKYPSCKFWYDGLSPSSVKFLKYPNFINQSQFYKKYGRINHILNILTFHKKEDFFIRSVFKRQSDKCCASVMIGGSMFMQDKLSPSDRVKLEESRLDVFPRFIIGANFGPYESDEFRKEFVGYFQRCAGVTFRDRFSYDLFMDIESVSYAPDVVLGLNLPEGNDAQSEDIVVISVIDPHSRPAISETADTYERFILEFCKECISRGKKPILLSCCKDEGDSAEAYRILERADEEMRSRIGLFEYAGDLDKALSLFQKAEFILASRFHAMILALKFHKPFFSIAYNQKIEWVLNDLHLDAYCSIVDVDGLRPSSILDRYKKPVDAEEYIQKSSDQFALFERLVINE